MMRDVYEVFNVVENQSWDDETKLLLATNYIEKKKLIEDFQSYLQEIADEEEDCSGSWPE
jgi:hypothetical protein